MVEKVKDSEQPQATLPATGEEFSVVVQDEQSRRIDDNDRVAGRIEPKSQVFEDPFDAGLIYDVSLKLTPYGLPNDWYPGFMLKVNRTSEYDPWGEQLWQLHASFGSIAVSLVNSEQDGKYISHDTSLNNRGLITTIAKRTDPDPTAQWAPTDKSAAIYLDLASALPADPQNYYQNTKVIFPFRGDADFHARLLEPDILSVVSAVTLTPAFLNELVEFTGLLVDATIAAPAGAINGKKMVIRILASGADRALTWDVYYRPIGVALPAVAPADKWVYVIGYFNSNGTKFDVTEVQVQA